MNNDLLSLNPLDSPPPEQTPAAPAGSADLMEQFANARAALEGGDLSAVETLRKIAEAGSDPNAALQASQALCLHYGSDQVMDLDRAKYYLDRARSLGDASWADLATCLYIHDKAWADLSDSNGVISHDVFFGEYAQRMDKAAEYLLAAVDSSETRILELANIVVLQGNVGDNLCMQNYSRNWGVLFRLAKRISTASGIDMLVREEAAAQAVMVLRKAKENKSGSKKDYDLAMKETLSKDEKALLKDIGKFVGQEGSESLLHRIPRLCWLPVALLCGGYYTFGFGELNGVWSLCGAFCVCGLILSVLCACICMATKDKGISFPLLLLACMYSVGGAIGGLVVAAIFSAFIGRHLGDRIDLLIACVIESFCTIRIGLKAAIDQ